MSSNLIRRGGLAAMVGGILGLLHSPFYAVAYFATEGGAESLEAPWVAAWSGAFRSLFEPLLTFAPPGEVYLTYGKLFLFMFLGWLVGLLALHARQTVRAGRLEKWGFRVALAGAVLGTLGSIGAYWIGSVWRGAVNFSFLALLVPALLLFNIGFPLFGFGTLRAKVAPRLGAWLLTVGGFPGIFLLTFLLGNLGVGMVLLNLAWGGAGVRALVGKGHASQVIKDKRL
jgi:hypothetical protein